MAQSKKIKKQISTVAETPQKQDIPMLLWLIFFANSLFFLPGCLDRYLAPRFLFLSLILLIGFALLWRQLRLHADWRLHGFDLLIVLWYGMNWAAISWAWSWSEGLFYAQKVLLFLCVYWLVRQFLFMNEALVWRTLWKATIALTVVVCSILLVQLADAITGADFTNENLYNDVIGVFGNKSLAADVLFLLLIFNGLFYREYPQKWIFPVLGGLLVILIVLLQTRTVYVALFASAVLYTVIHSAINPVFRKITFKFVLPAFVAVLLLFLAVLSKFGKGSSLAERLNPATYSESFSARERQFVWSRTDALNEEHFWFGVGNGSWKLWFPSKSISGGYRLEERNIVFTRAHNDYLEIRAEMGIIGATLFCFIFGIAALIGLIYLFKAKMPLASRHTVLVLLCGLLGYCIIQYFDFPRERIEIQAMLAIIFGFLAHYCKGIWDNVPGIGISKWSNLWIGLMVGGLTLNIGIGWSRVNGEMHYLKALKAQSKGDFRTMAIEANAASNRFHEYNDVAIPFSWSKGIALYQIGKFDEAVKSFATAYKLNPFSFQVMSNYASALTRVGRNSEAIPLYENVLMINPKYDEAKFNLAFALFQLGEYTKSADWLTKVDTIADPKTVQDIAQNKETLQRLESFQKYIETIKDAPK